MYDTAMKKLPIVWQRLIDSKGQTCDRCGSTYEGLLQALEKLKKALRPLDIDPIVEIREIDRDSFSKDPDQSNRIWIAGKPIEEWLNAKVSSSPCCTVCGDSECRTIEIDNDVYEIIPPELILKATLLAAAQMVASTTQDSRKNPVSGCCPE